MSYAKELLLLQLAHAKQAIDRARNNRYSDTEKQAYQEKLVALFEKVEDYVVSTPTLDDAAIYAGPKKHLDFIFKSLEFLDNSTLNQIPYEIVACLKEAMSDWLDKDTNYIIVTSLINDVKGFSYDRMLATEGDLYSDIEKKYQITFEHRLVQINLPRTFARDYFATVVLYHELGHFINANFALVRRAFIFLLGAIKDEYTDEQLEAIKGYLPDLRDYIDNKELRDQTNWLDDHLESYTHLEEYFCDLFAAQYVGKAANQYVTYLTSDGNVASPTHPSSRNREKVVCDYISGASNIIVELLQYTLKSMKKPPLQQRYESLDAGVFFELMPPVIVNTGQLHGILHTAWQVWLNNRDQMLQQLNTSENLKCYSAINNLVEKAIGNYITIREWNKGSELVREPLAPTQKYFSFPDIDMQVQELMPGYLSHSDVQILIKSAKLYIRPLLSDAQIGQVGIDFRLGHDFLVSTQGREAFINASKNNWYDHGEHHNVRHFFQSTRRQLGETFILHPHQTVLAVTLEYVRLPDDCVLKLIMRSSYARLGITINTMAQPGYVGCLNLELTNNNNNPINLAVGARLVQGLVYKTAKPSKYFSAPRKYICQVRPEPSAVIHDKDLEILNELWKHNNKK